MTAPDLIRDRYRPLRDTALIEQLAWLRPTADSFLAGIGTTLKSIARRHLVLGVEIDDFEPMLAELAKAANPGLVAANGDGTITATQLLVTAGDNRDQLRDEAVIAALAGVRPMPASSGTTTRQRLTKGEGRQANAASHGIALARMSSAPRTRV